MILPKLIYEPLPYSFATGGLTGVAISSETAIMLLSLFCYGYGVWVLIQRSRYRRHDHIANNVVQGRLKRPHKPLPFADTPELLYELQPFCYLLLGIWLSSSLQQPLLVFASLAIVFAGMTILVIRWNHRHGHAEHLYANSPSIPPLSKLNDHS